jgi:3-hydroxyisobutyrate dehydrogenase-like beta-hydroxyacid dehydrogenase
MKLGYIGYGEAAFSMSEGLYRDGFRDQYAYSRNFSYAGKPEEAGVTRCKTLEELFAVCDVVFSMTPSSAAVEMAAKCAPYLRGGIVYCDFSSASPKLMEEAAALVEPTGALFVDGAMLDTVPKFRHKVPITVSGNGADELLKRIFGLGMNMDKVGDKPGAGSAIKMLRSLYTKGHLGFALEMLEGACAYGVEDYIMKSLAETMDGKTFEEGMDGRVCGGIIHAARRADELDMAAGMLDDAGLSSAVSHAAAQKLREIGGLDLKKSLGEYRPKTWKDAMECVMRRREELEKKK